VKAFGEFIIGHPYPQQAKNPELAEGQAMDFRENLLFLRSLLLQVFFYLRDPVHFPVFLPQEIIHFVPDDGEDKGPRWRPSRPEFPQRQKNGEVDLRNNVLVPEFTARGLMDGPLYQAAVVPHDLLHEGILFC